MVPPGCPTLVAHVNSRSAPLLLVTGYRSVPDRARWTSGGAARPSPLVSYLRLRPLPVVSLRVVLLYHRPILPRILRLATAGPLARLTLVAEGEARPMSHRKLGAGRRHPRRPATISVAGVSFPGDGIQHPRLLSLPLRLRCEPLRMMTAAGVPQRLASQRPRTRQATALAANPMPRRPLRRRNRRRRGAATRPVVNHRRQPNVSHQPAFPPRLVYAANTIKPGMLGGYPLTGRPVTFRQFVKRRLHNRI